MNIEGGIKEIRLNYSNDPFATGEIAYRVHMKGEDYKVNKSMTFSLAADSKSIERLLRRGYIYHLQKRYSLDKIYSVLFDMYISAGDVKFYAGTRYFPTGYLFSIRTVEPFEMLEAIYGRDKIFLFDYEDHNFMGPFSEEDIIEEEENIEYGYINLRSRNIIPVFPNGETYCQKCKYIAKFVSTFSGCRLRFKKSTNEILTLNDIIHILDIVKKYGGIE